MRSFARLIGSMTAVVVTTLISPAFTQVKNPTALSHDLRPLAEVDRTDMPALNLEAIAAEDLQNEALGVPLRFAIPHPVAITPDTHGTWDVLATDVMVWRHRITAQNAQSINLGFTRYTLPENATLFFHTTDMTRMIRPFTSADNDLHGELWTPVLPGNDVIIELTIERVDRFNFELELGSINLGYRAFGSIMDALRDKDGPLAGSSGSCNVDVACPEGIPWQNEIPSNAAYSLGGSIFCSGVVMNNTAEDFTPYFLTANHCGLNGGNAASLVVYWNFQNSTCRAPGSGASGGPGDGTLNEFNTGSFHRASYAPSDFTLMELDDPISGAFGVTYSGWDRSDVAPASCVAIHHPQGAEKRISFENDPLSVTSYLGNSSPGDGTHLRVIDWDLGTTEPGSSGSPIYSPEHRVVGQLHGGAAACGNNSSDWYGRLNVSWTGGGSSSSRLSDWLDPLMTGATTLDTLAPGADNTNNACLNATPVGLGATPFDTTAASTDGPPDAACLFSGDNQVSQDIWFSFTSPIAGDVTISLCDSDYDAKLAVYQGCTCPASNLIACDDDFCGVAAGAEVEIPVIQGACYLIRVGGFGAATGTGNLVIGQIGDECTVAFPATDQSYIAFTNDNLGASGDDTSCTPGDTVDEWYRYTATCDGVATATTCDSISGYDTSLAVFDACDGTELRCDDDDDNVADGVACSFNDKLSTVRWSVSSGSDYLVRISGPGGAVGLYRLTFSCDPCPADTNSSGDVDVVDLLNLLGKWGACEDCPEDINGDDVVDVADLLLILGAWGPC